MESKMAEISHLMGQFADKIADQHREIELIHEHAKETKDNVLQVRVRPEGVCQSSHSHDLSVSCVSLLEQPHSRADAPHGPQLRLHGLLLLRRVLAPAPRAALLSQLTDERRGQTARSRPRARRRLLC